MVGCDDDAAIKYAEHPWSRLRRSLLGESGDFGVMLKLHSSFGVIVMHRQNGRAFSKVTRMPLNPLPFLMIC